MAGTTTTKLPRATVGILGGSGLYEIEGFKNKREVRLRTPFGEPSGPFVVGALEGRRVAFLARHGRGHRILPSEINFRANIYGFKMLGVERIVSISSVGSLREEIPPRDLVLPDQFFDRGRRPGTFFGGGIVAHVSLAQPVCPELAGLLHETAAGLGLRSHLGGTYVCIDGPAFSTKAESKAYRAWGGHVIGMTAATEARLCREAEICYATLCLVTDYDVWHETEEPVTVELVMQNMAANIANAKAVLRRALAGLGPGRGAGCGCASALQNTIMTDPAVIPAAARRKLDLLVGKYLPKTRGRQQ